MVVLVWCWPRCFAQLGRFGWSRAAGLPVWPNRGSLAGAGELASLIGPIPNKVVREPGLNQGGCPKFGVYTLYLRVPDNNLGNQWDLKAPPVPGP